jgi:hypothetical protein
MMTLLFLIVPLLFVAGGFVVFSKVSWRTALIQAGVSLVLAFACSSICFCQVSDDTELWSGRVVSKAKERVSCEHSYRCFCHTECSSAKEGSTCTEVCSTCYEHTNDWDWRVKTSNKESIEIPRVDSQGVIEPPRFSQVRIGEPTAIPHTYTSYIKAAPDSLFRRKGLKDKYLGALPKYPDSVYDYYHVNRFLTVGFSVQNAKVWNDGLAEINGDLGRSRQVNMLVVLTNQPPEWFYALEEHWLGAKKNDVVLVIGVNYEGKPEWANVMAWTTEKSLEVKLRDAVVALPEVTAATTLPILHDIVKASYRRKPMADFEYLKASVRPSGVQVFLVDSFILTVLGVWIFILYRNRPRRYRYQY